MAKADLTAARLRELLHYDPETGVFRVKTRFNRKQPVGTISGSDTKRGYRKHKLDGGTYLAHRLAWLYVTGRWPEYTIDHIDCDGYNNRFLNLRDVPQNVNAENQRKAKRVSASGLIGAFSRRTRWVAQIRVRGRLIYLGSYDAPEDAHAAYVAAKREHHEGNTL